MGDRANLQGRRLLGLLGALGLGALGYSAPGDKTVKLFNVNDGAVLRTFNLRQSVERLALLPDGLRFVYCWGDSAYIAYHGF